MMNRNRYTRRTGTYAGGRRYAGRTPVRGYGIYSPRDMIITMVDDPMRGIAITVVMVLFALMLVIGGICIWPYLIDSALQTEDFLSQPTGKMILAGGISGVVGLLQSIYLCWFFEWDDANDFSFGKIWTVVYAACFILNAILLPVFGANLLGISNPSMWSQILGFLFYGVLAALLAVVPSFLSAVFGYCMNGLWYISHRHLE